jgi:hypothetical protein
LTRNRSPIPEEEEAQDVDMSFVDAEGSLDTIMKEASSIREEQANLHKKTEAKKPEIIEIDEFPPLKSPPKLDKTHNNPAMVLPSQCKNNNKNASNNKFNTTTDLPANSERNSKTTETATTITPTKPIEPVSL